MYQYLFESYKESEEPATVVDALLNIRREFRLPRLKRGNAFIERYGE